MGNLKTNWRRAALLFVAWTLVGLVFAAVSYGVALSQNDKRFGIAASLIVIGAHALLYYDDFRTSELQQSSLKAQLAQAQLRALKMQVHPHFLFNTLHSISSLVLEDPPKANSMIARLGDFLRLTLDHADHELVTLKEETEFLRAYLDIEQVRFGDRLKV